KFQANDAAERQNVETEEPDAEEPDELDPEFEEAFTVHESEAEAPKAEAEAEADAQAQAAAAEQPAEPEEPFEGAGGWISVAEASEKLKSIVRGAFADPRPARQLLVTSPAGIGKTDAVINEALHYTTGWRPEDMGKPLLDQDPHICL